MTQIYADKRRRTLAEGHTNPTTDITSSAQAPDQAIPAAQRLRIRCTFKCEESGEFAHLWKTQDVEDFQCETSLPKEKEEKLLQSFRQCFTSIASEQSINSHGVSEGNVNTGGESSQQVPVAAEYYREAISLDNGSSESEGREPRYTIITVSEHSAITRFFDEQLRRVGQTSLKKILKAWIREIHPRKQSGHPYNGGKTKEEAIRLLGKIQKGALTKPSWWPDGLRHCEPDHLLKHERLDLAQRILRHPRFHCEKLRKSTIDIASSLESRSRDIVANSLSHIYDTRETEERYERDEISGDHKIPILALDPREGKARQSHKVPRKSKKALKRPEKKKGRRTTRKRRSSTRSQHDSPNPNRDLSITFPADSSLPIFNYGVTGPEYHHIAPLSAGFLEQAYCPTVNMDETSQVYSHQNPFMSQFPGMEGVLVDEYVQSYPNGMSREQQPPCVQRPGTSTIDVGISREQQPPFVQWLGTSAIGVPYPSGQLSSDDST